MPHQLMSLACLAAVVESAAAPYQLIGVRRSVGCVIVVIGREATKVQQALQVSRAWSYDQLALVHDWADMVRHDVREAVALLDRHREERGELADAERG